MVRRCFHLTTVILWLVQAVHSGGYKPQNGRGVGTLLMPSKGVGHAVRPQNGYAGYPMKGPGYGATAGTNKGSGMKGYGQTAGQMSEQGGRQLGYGVKAGPVTGQMNGGFGAQQAFGGAGAKGNGRNPAGSFNRNGVQPNVGYGVSAGPLSGPQIKGFNPQAGGYGATKGNGYEAAAASQYTPGIRGNVYGSKAGPSIRQLKSGYVAQTGGNSGQGEKPNGYGAVAGPSTGQQMRNGYNLQSGGQTTKGNGQGVVAGPSTANGAYGQGGMGSKLMKGYGRTPYGSGVQRGVLGGLGVPRPARNQQKSYGSRTGDRGQPNSGYNGGYGSTALGPRYGNGGMKGPVKGYANLPHTGNRGAVLNGYEQQGGGVAAKPAKSGGGSIPNGYGARPNGNPHLNGGSGRPQPSFGATAEGGVFKGYGTKPSGHGGNGAVLSGYGRQPNGYNLMPNGKGQAVRGTEVSGERNLKGGVHFHHHHHQQQQMTAQLGDVTPRAATPPIPAPTGGLLVMVTQEKYQKLPSPLPQGKKYKHTAILPEESPEPAPAYPEARGQHLSLEPAPIGPKDKNQKGVHSGPAVVVPQSKPAPEPAAVQGYVTGNAVHLQKAAEADAVGLGGGAPKTKAVPETAEERGGVPPKETLITAGVGESAAEEADAQPDRLQGTSIHAGETESRGSSASKGPGAKLDCGLNGQWMKIPRPDYNAAAGSLDGSQTKGYGAGENAFLNNGYGAGLGYPYAGKAAQAGYGKGVHPGAGYENGNPYGGYRNGYGAGPQPDYSSYGQGVPTIDGKSGGNPGLPAGLDGMSQFEPQSVGLGPNGKGVMYGVGGLQFGGQPGNSGINGAGQYGGVVASMGGSLVPGMHSYGGYAYNQNAPGKQGYGRLPYGVQQAGLNPEAKAAAQYGHTGSSYQPESVGFGQPGKTAGSYSGGQAAFAPQALGFGGDDKSGKYDKQGAFQSQRLRPEETAGQTYERQSVGLDSAGKSYVKGEVPTATLAAESERIPINKYENVGYINGQMQPEVAGLPAAPTASSTLAFSSPDGIPVEDVQDIPDPEGTASFLESGPVTEMLGESRGPEDAENLPRQIHIQQHLKLHFNPQGKKNGKYDANGFFGNNGY
ncbi:uncharacterized protein cmn isoform X3 [Oryzias latipes]